MALDPEFVERAEKPVVALSRDFTMSTRQEIPKLWEDYWSRDWNLGAEQEQASVSASYAVNPDGSFSYAVGIAVTPIPDPLPQDSCIVTLSAGRYAVFRDRGLVRGIPVLFDAVFSRSRKLNCLVRNRISSIEHLLRKDHPPIIWSMGTH